MKTTLDTVKQEITIVSSVPTDPARTRVNELRRELFPGSFAVDTPVDIAMRKAGFTWVVTPSLITRFKYAATVIRQCPNSPVSGCGPLMQSPVSMEDGKGIQYAGDVPDDVLPRMKLAMDSGVSCFTIHSNQRLPVKFTIPGDPVLIGWLGNPFIERVGLLTHHFEQKNEHAVGYVIAVWDEKGLS